MSPKKELEREIEASLFLRIIIFLIIQLRWVLLTFVAFIVLMAQHLHINWNLLFKYTDSLKWPTVVLVGLVLYKTQMPGVVRGFWNRLHSINTPLGGVQLSPSVPPPQPLTGEEINEGIEADVGGFLKEAAEGVEIIPDVSNRQALVLKIQLEFERTYRQIYGTQVQALYKLRPYESVGGLTEDEFNDLFKVYQERIRAYPPLVAYPTVVDWLGFPVSRGLIDWNPSSKAFNINEVGKAFLTYLEKQGLTSDARPF